MSTEPVGDAQPVRPRAVGLRIAAAVVVIVTYLGFMLLLIAVGSCEAFGGRCDGSRPPILEDDVGGGAFFATVPAVWALWMLWRPSKRRALTGLAVAVATAACVALVARNMAYS